MAPESWGIDGLYRLFLMAGFSLLMLALFLVCALFFLFGVIFFGQSVYLRRHGVRVKGQVVGIDESKDTECGGYRIVEYTDLQGHTHRRTLTMASSEHPPVGQPMDLVYDPAKPADVSSASRSDLWIFPLVFCILGGIGAVGVIVVVIKTVSQFLETH